MRIDIEFKYETSKLPVVTMHAYQINDQIGLRKALNVLKCLEQCIKIVNPEQKDGH